MYRAHGAIALLLLMGLSTDHVSGQAKSKGGAINSLDDAIAVAKKDKMLIVVSFENPK